MKLVKLTATNGDCVYVNLDNVAEIIAKEDGCEIYYTTPDTGGDQVRRVVKEPVETILRQIPE